VPGEVRPLVAEVNDLMQRLGTTLDFQNRFIADAAHQLKTPVSGSRRRSSWRCASPSRQRLQHSLAQLYLGATACRAWCSQLLSLARNEAGRGRSRVPRAGRPGGVGARVAWSWVPLAIKRDIDLGFEAPVSRC
jgi:two-component system sensor histidine kinase TctE